MIFCRPAGPGAGGEGAVMPLQKKLGYFFKDQEILSQAVTHRSFSHEHQADRVADNERLEFLGDAVLNLILSRLIYDRYPGLTEGELSKLRASLVNERQLKEIAEKLGLGKLLRLGKGEELTGGREKGSLLADALEALLGAVYLEGGFEAAFGVTETLFAPLLPIGHTGRIPDLDYKTELQEYGQGFLRITPSYEVLREEGPDHSKVFFVTVRLGPKRISQGRGRSKKAAEQEAARRALKFLRGRDVPDS